MYPPPSYDNAKYSQGYQPDAMNIRPRQPFPPSNLATGTRWSTSLCHCCDDPANCLITCFCPCVTFGQIAEIVNKGAVSCAASGAVYGLLLGFVGSSCLYSCFYRSRLRGQYDLEEAPCADCLTHFCCEPCALCQEYRELKNRGFDMGIGWQANMDRQNRGITIAPVVGGMSR
ncbi:cell number regulator 1-like isoform X1 [Mangifera indica]|uniref:cell number regulator 1-like isoform X1 n=1 Tax=Mangifera indica TaxID=29780 RepID=UPI001CF98302|nr:cell number regulator 1-like isoform X1 [Mangifera indica]XP_044480305.1 cell number regulator 1-like isoform X1 [Mangifera indica]